MDEMLSNAIRSIDAIQRAGTAAGVYDRIVDHIRDFEESLDDNHEVGVRLAAFGQSILIYVTSVGYSNPQVITFHGTTEDGTPVRLLQHMTQLNFLLVAVKRTDPSKPKRKIGF